MNQEDKKIASQKIGGFISEGFREYGFTPSAEQVASLREQIELDLEVNGWTMQKVDESERGSHPAELMLNFPQTTRYLQKLMALVLQGRQN